MAAVHFDEEAAKVIAQCGIELLAENIIVNPLSPEEIERTLSPDKRKILRELGKKR